MSEGAPAAAAPAATATVVRASPAAKAALSRPPTAPLDPEQEKLKQERLEKIRKQQEERRRGMTATAAPTATTAGAGATAPAAASATATAASPAVAAPATAAPKPALVQRASAGALTTGAAAPRTSSSGEDAGPSATPSDAEAESANTSPRGRATTDSSTLQSPRGRAAAVATLGASSATLAVRAAGRGKAAPLPTRMMNRASAKSSDALDDLVTASPAEDAGKALTGSRGSSETPVSPKGGVSPREPAEQVQPVVVASLPAKRAATTTTTAPPPPSASADDTPVVASALPARVKQPIARFSDRSMSDAPPSRESGDWSDDGGGGKGRLSAVRDGSSEAPRTPETSRPPRPVLSNAKPPPPTSEPMLVDASKQAQPPRARAETSFSWGALSSVASTLWSSTATLATATVKPAAEHPPPPSSPAIQQARPGPPSSQAAAVVAPAASSVAKPAAPSSPAPTTVAVDARAWERQERVLNDMTESMEALRLIVAKQGSALRQQEVQMASMQRRIDELEQRLL